MATTVDTRRETASLIGSDKVDGTAVYGADNQKIGSVQRVMIDKISGKVAYAVVSFGGFLGMGEDYFPMPWASLNYDTNLGGYRTNMTESQLKGRRSLTRTRTGIGRIGREIGRYTTTIRHRFGIEECAERVHCSQKQNGPAVTAGPHPNGYVSLHRKSRAGLLGEMA